MQDPLVLAAQAILVATAANISGSAYADLQFQDEAPIAVAFTNALTRMGISDSAAAQAVAVMGYSIDSATFCRLRNGSRQQYTRDETLFYAAVAVALAQHMHLHLHVDKEGILAAAIDLVLRATRHRLWQISRGQTFSSSSDPASPPSPDLAHGQVAA